MILDSDSIETLPSDVTLSPGEPADDDVIFDRPPDNETNNVLPGILEESEEPVEEPARTVPQSQPDNLLPQNVTVKENPQEGENVKSPEPEPESLQVKEMVVDLPPALTQTPQVTPSIIAEPDVGYPSTETQTNPLEENLKNLEPESLKVEEKVVDLPSAEIQTNPQVTPLKTAEPDTKVPLTEIQTNPLKDNLKFTEPEPLKVEEKLVDLPSAETEANPQSESLTGKEKDINVSSTEIQLNSSVESHPSPEPEPLKSVNLPSAELKTNPEEELLNLEEKHVETASIETNLQEKILHPGPEPSKPEEKIPDEPVKTPSPPPSPTIGSDTSAFATYKPAKEPDPPKQVLRRQSSSDEKRGVFTKILEFVGVVKKKEEVETSIFYDDPSPPATIQEEPAKPAESDGVEGIQEILKATDLATIQDEKEDTMKRSPSPRVQITPLPETVVIAATPPTSPDQKPPRRDPEALTVDNVIPETPPVTAGEKKTPIFDEPCLDRDDLLTEIDGIIEKAKLIAEDQLDDVSVLASDVVFEPTKPPIAILEEFEEIRVTSAEERQRPAAKSSSSKLSEQILKAIPPPRRRAISDSKTTTSGQSVSVQVEKSLDVVSEQPPPVPPRRRNRSKQREGSAKR